MPQPTQADLDYLAKHPEAAEKFRARFGSLPASPAPTPNAPAQPTPQDIEYLTNNPDARAKFEARFGPADQYLPKPPGAGEQFVSRIKDTLQNDPRFQFAYGAEEGLASLPGAPVDLIVGGGNFLRRQMDLPETPLEDTPVANWGGSGWVEWARKNGLISTPPGPEPTEGINRVARKAGQFTGASAPFGVGALASVPTAVAGSEIGRAVDPGGYGEAIGGLVGAFAAPAVVAGARGAKNALTPKTTPEKAQLAQELINRGVPVLPAQLAKSPAVRRTYQMLTRVLPGESEALANQQKALNKSVGGLFGAPAEQLTPAVVGGAKNTIGSEISSTVARSGIPMPQQAEAYLRASLPNPNKVTAENFRIAKAHIDEIIDDANANGGALTGEKFHDYTKFDSDLARMARSNDSTLAIFAKNARKRLTDMWEANAKPADIAAFREAKQKYAMLKTVEPMLGRSPTGTVSPGQMLGALNPGKSGLASRVGGDMEALARGADELIKPLSSSGTAENATMIGMAAGGMQAAGQAMAGNFAPLTYMLTTATGAQMFRKFLENPKVAEKMIQVALNPKTPQPIAQRLRLAIPALRKSLPAGIAAAAIGGQNLAVQAPLAAGP